MQHSYNKNKEKSRVMRRIVYLLAIIALLLACVTQKNTVHNNKKNAETTGVDTLEYDVEMFDAKFDAWYQHYLTPATYRQQSYYELWNMRYVTMWNSKANSSAGEFPFEPVVGFEPGYDYGFELNHKLFHYFMYVEDVLKIKIMPSGPNFIVR